MSFHPRTPQSPSQFSPATSADPSLGSSSSMTVVGTGTTTLPTPAHSVNGCSSQTDTVMGDDSPHKRKRHLDDVGDDRQNKKIHLDDCKLGIEDLHRDVGKKYLLCQSRKTLLCCSLLTLPLGKRGISTVAGMLFWRTLSLLTL